MQTSLCFGPMLILFFNLAHKNGFFSKKKKSEKCIDIGNCSKNRSQQNIRHNVAMHALKIQQTDFSRKIRISKAATPIGLKFSGKMLKNMYFKVAPLPICTSSQKHQFSVKNRFFGHFLLFFLFLRVFMTR